MTIGGIVGLVLGLILIYTGATRSRTSTDPSVTVTNDQGQSAPLTGESAKWVLIIVGIVLAVGGLIGIIAGLKH